MLFADIDLLDENLDFRSHCWVGVRDGRVAYVGDAAPAGEEAARYGEVYDGRGKLLCPAFYNAHAHAPMTLLRGYAENLPLQAWLNDMVFPFEAKITPEDCYWGTLLSCAEMARYGCVSFSDMYYHMEEGARAALDAGIKMNLSDSLLAFNGEGLDDLPVKGNLDRLIRDVQGAGDGRIVVTATSMPSTRRTRAPWPIWRRTRRSTGFGCRCTSPRRASSTRSASSATTV